MRPFSILAAIAALGICACTDAATATTTPKAATATTIATTTTPRTGPKPVLSVTWRRDGKLIMLPVRVNGGAPAWFTLDSGAPHSIIDPRLARELGLKTMSTSSVTGTGKGRVGVDHVGPVTLEIQGLKLPVEDPWVIDLSGVPIDKSVRGLVGQDLLARYVVRLDPRTRTLEAFEPADWAPPEDGAVLPLIVENGKLYIEARIDVKPGLSVTHRLRLDTGSEEFVNDSIVAQSPRTQLTTLGNGLGENYQALSGVYDAVHFGPYIIRNGWGPGGDRPSLGMEVLRRFVTTFDVPRRRLHLLPTPALHEPVPAPAPEVVVSPGRSSSPAGRSRRTRRR